MPASTSARRAATAASPLTPGSWPRSSLPGASQPRSGGNFAAHNAVGVADTPAVGVAVAAPVAGAGAPTIAAAS